MELNQKPFDRMTKEKSDAMKKNINQTYKQTLTNIRGILGNYFTKYETNGKLTYQELMKFGRMSKLEEDLLHELNQLYKFKKNEFNKHFEDMFQSMYFQLAFLLETQTQTKLGFRALKKEFIESIVQQPIGGKSIRERLKDNHESFGKTVRSTVITSLVAGATYKQLDKAIKKEINKDFTNAVFIHEQENKRLESEAFQSTSEHAAKKMKIQKKWVSVLDSRTRKNHQRLDGQIVDVDDYFRIGSRKAMQPRKFGVKAEDINCRCSMIIVYEEAILDERRQSEQSKVIPYETYEDWAKHRITT